MAQLGSAWVQGPDGKIELPIYDLADVSEDRWRAATASGVGAIPLVPPGEPNATRARIRTPDGTRCAADSIYTPEHLIVYQGSQQEFQRWDPETATKISVVDLPVDHYPNNRLIGDMVSNPRDGSFYMVQDGDLWKYTAEGTLEWHHYESGNPVSHQLAVTRDGALVAGWSKKDIDTLRVLEPNGTTRWKKELPGSPHGVAVDRYNDIYVYMQGSGLYKFTPDGKSIWKNTTIPSSAEGLAVNYYNGNMLLWLGSPSTGSLWVYRASSGNLDNELTTPFDPYFPRAVPDGSVTIGGGPDDRMALIEPDGTVRWSHKIHDGANGIHDEDTGHGNTYEGDRTMRPHGIAPDGSGGYVAVFGSWDHLVYVDVDAGTAGMWFDDGNHESVTSEWGLVGTWPELYGEGYGNMYGYNYGN